MISCLCVTRGNRLPLLAQAVADFAAQTHADRELLLLHDSGPAVQQQLLDLAAAHAGSAIRVVAVAPGARLGGLRNQAVALAAGDWVCQWDDDDRYHPQRLAQQWQAAQAAGARACYLVDQLHVFVPDGLLCWDDWHGEPYPMNVVQGTLLARRDEMPDYPDWPRAEDTGHTEALMRRAAQAGWPVARLRGAGWCYAYQWHGGNVWDADHHRAISRAKHLPPQRLIPRLAELRQRLADYQPPLAATQLLVGAERRPLQPA